MMVLRNRPPPFYFGVLVHDFVTEKELRTVRPHALASLIVQHEERQRMYRSKGHYCQSSAVSGAGTQTHLQWSTPKGTYLEEP